METSTNAAPPVPLARLARPDCANCGSPATYSGLHWEAGTVYENRGGEVWERHPDGRRELFAADIIRKLTDLEMQRNEAIEIARRVMETVMQIYGHAQFCDECQSFEIADSCRIQMHGMGRINSLLNAEVRHAQNKSMNTPTNSEALPLTNCSPSYPKNVAAFVAKWQPNEGARMKAFWKEFRKAANAYSAAKNITNTTKPEEALDEAWDGIAADVRYEMCKDSFSIGFRMGANSILENVEFIHHEGEKKS